MKEQTTTSGHEKRGPLSAVWLTALLLVLFVATACGGEETTAGAERKRIEGIPIGQTQESAKLSEEDGKPYPVEITFKSVERDATKVQEAIEKYNVSAAGHMIPALDDDKCAYAIAYYEVKYPESFVDTEYGILDVAPEFSIVSATGETDITAENISYKGLDQTWELGYQPKGYDFYPGDTYEGVLVFIMVEGYNDFLIKETYPTDDKGGRAEHYYSGK